MANGKIGDGALSDMLNHGLHPFPADIEQLLREVLALQPKFPDGRRPYVQQVYWMHRIEGWAQGKDLDQGRVLLKQVLAELRSNSSAGG